MKRTLIIGLAGATAVLGFVGCGQDQAPAPAEPAQEVTAPAGETAVTDEALTPEDETKLIDQAIDAASDLSARVKEQADAAMDGVSDIAESTLEGVTEARDGIIAQAESLLGQAEALIGQERIDEARGLLEQLAAMKDSLSTEMRDRIERLEAMLQSE